jgi:hypothetical protein
MAQRNCSLFVAASAASLIVFSLATGCRAQQPAASSSGPAIQLQPYTTPDQSASAGVPAGWQVTSGKETVIELSGPQGVTVELGNTFVARNAAFQAGQRGANGIDLSMPYSASLPQKLGMIIQQNAALAGTAAPQLTLASATPIQLPAALGQCGRFVANATSQQGAMKLMAVFCSLPLDSGGVYKNILLLAQAPAAVATEAAPTAQAVFQSYKIPAAWLQKKLAPINSAATAASVAQGAANLAQAQAIMRSTAKAQAVSDNSANCFDLVVLRSTPAYQLPRSCGGTAPN